MAKEAWMQWPDGFIWGTGASSTQSEGAAPASDWWKWERAGHAPISGEGNRFSSRFVQDFDLLSKLGLKHHRLSIEWARIEPEQGVYDARAIALYRSILQAARDAGIIPWACLHHFTLPYWFADLGGFLVTKNRTEVWRRHVDFIAETFGDLVGGWQPVNETNYYALAAYRGGGWPPGQNDRDACAVVSEAIHLATAEAAVRLRQTGAPVASIFGLSAMVAQDDEPATLSRIAHIRKTHWDPGVGLLRDGILRVPGRPPIERPDLAGCFDLFGFSYYAAMGVRSGQIVMHPPDAEVSPLGYGIWADGLGIILDELHAALPHTPILIAEYGIGTSDDDLRSRYLTRGLAVTREAIARGIDVRGFFHWTAVDNYEWLHGFDVPFGIIDCDRKVQTSAGVLQRAAQSGMVCEEKTK
ncbi:MAG: glycoside hydrolase family 1 protein [Desulfobacteraceae bacterium]|nr:glycoside hydrolase family 1 protein [Desulfobacteraceae bacterium]MBU4055573.1 family 1 glycosylhydrolase [Pseudomonadota bacterium]